MSISWLKYKDDNLSFKFFKKFGLDVFDIEDLDKTDEKLNELVQQKYTTIVISSEVASFSQDVIKKYSKQKDINIIIAPNKIR